MTHFQAPYRYNTIIISCIADVFVGVGYLLRGAFGQNFAAILDNEKSVLKLGVRVILANGCEVVLPGLQLRNGEQSYDWLDSEDLSFLDDLLVLLVD